MDNEQRTLSAADIAQYDRQIRVWGMEAQKLLGKAKILVVGIRGLGSEVVKNIALAGVKTITLLDDGNITENDLNSQLLITPDCLGQNRAEASFARTQELNPNVIVEVDKESIDSKSDEFFASFDVVCLTKCDLQTQLKVDFICRMNKVKFFCGDIIGFFGYCFTDVGVHEYVEEKEVLKSSTEDKDVDHNAKMHKKDEYEKVLVKKTEEFCSLEESLNENWKKRSRRDLKYSSPVFFIIQSIHEFVKKYSKMPERKKEDKDNLTNICKDILNKYGMKEDFVPPNFIDFCFNELSPVCAVVGGVLSQEIIKVVSCQDAPHNNYFMFNGMNHSGIVDMICPNK